MELKECEVKTSSLLLSVIPVVITNENYLTNEQIQFVYSVVADDGLAHLQNLDNRIATSHPQRVESVVPIVIDGEEKLQINWTEMTEAEALRDFDKEYRRYCKLAINGYHIRKNNLKGWQKDLEEALTIEGEEYWNSSLIDNACNYQQVWVEIPRTSQRTKDLKFLLKWCMGIQKIVGQNTSVIKVAEWKIFTGCEILGNGHIRFDGTPRQFFAMAKKKGIHSLLPDNATLSLNVEVLTKKTGEYRLRDIDSWNKAKNPPRKRK